MTTRSKLGIHLVFDSADDIACELAERLFVELQADPRRLGMERINLPVRVLTDYPTTATGDEIRRVAPFDGSDCETNLIVVLVTNSMLSDERWLARLGELRTVCIGTGNFLLPLALTQQVFDQRNLFDSKSAVRLWNVAENRLNAAALIPVLVRTSRMLLNDTPVQLFISHAKQDGAELAAQVERAISTSKLDTFLDVFDIAEGDDFEMYIDDGLRSGVVAVLTDTYSSREWCRFEAFTAKRRGLPMVVLDALIGTEERSMPFLGNCPSVRFDPANPGESLDAVVTRLLREIVRMRAFALQVQRIDPDAIALPFPPELLPLRAAIDEKVHSRVVAGLAAPDPITVIYPDPPLAATELRVIQRAFSGPEQISLQTMTQAVTAASVATELSEAWVVVSISDPPEEVLAPLGLSNKHIDLLFIELCRQIIAIGHGLAYGGDLRQRGFTELLLEIARLYDPSLSVAPRERRRATPDARSDANSRLGKRVLFYLTTDSLRSATAPALARARSRTEVVSLSDSQRVADLVSRNVADNPDSTDYELYRSECLGMTRGDEQRAVREKQDEVARAVRLSDMRRESTTYTRADGTEALLARVVAGGKILNALGRAPGVLEEAALSVAFRRPLFVIGGFGGVGGLIADKLLGVRDLSQVVEAIEKAYERLAKLTETHLKDDEDRSARAMLARFPDNATDIGAVLRNGLTNDENTRLLTTRLIDEAVDLVITGLGRLSR